MSKLVTFTKMHGLGNDFVVIDAMSKPLLLSPSQIVAISDRHRGIGCDQVLLIEPSNDPDIDFFYRIYNADGSEVGQCGNGARCLAKYIREKNLSSKNKLRVKTLTSVLELYIEENTIRVNMGIPKDIKISEGISLTLGNPHIIFTTPDINDPSLNNLGLNDMNVGFMQIINRNYIKLRVFERGVGETQACGSGACAAVVAGIVQKLLDDTVTVELQGGKLDIHWQGSHHPVWMSGPAQKVFEGTVDLLKLG